MNLNEYANWVCSSMRAKGFHDGRDDRGRDDTMVRLALVHTEVSEATQVVKRKGLETEEQVTVFAEEIADVFIRLFDLTGCVGFDLESAVRAKMQKNMGRPHKYGTPDEGKK